MEEQGEFEVNWKVIFLLAALGPMTVIVFRQEFVRALPEWIIVIVMFLVLPGSCAGWIAKKVATKHFFHGAMVGFLLILGSALTRFVLASREWSEALDILLIGIPTGILVWGPYFGFFAWLAGKIIKARKPR